MALRKSRCTRNPASPEPWDQSRPQWVDLLRQWRALTSILSQSQCRNHTQRLWSAAKKWQLDPRWHHWSCWYHCKMETDAVNTPTNFFTIWPTCQKRSHHFRTHSDIRVLSSPTEVQSNQPISILITFLKYIFLMSWICLAAAITHREICWIWNSFANQSRGLKSGFPAHQKSLSEKELPESTPRKTLLLQFRRNRKQIVSFHIQCRGCCRVTGYSE